MHGCACRTSIFIDGCFAFQESNRSFLGLNFFSRLLRYIYIYIYIRPLNRWCWCSVVEFYPLCLSCYLRCSFTHWSPTVQVCHQVFLLLKSASVNLCECHILFLLLFVYHSLSSLLLPPPSPYHIVCCMKAVLKTQVGCMDTDTKLLILICSSFVMIPGEGKEWQDKMVGSRWGQTKLYHLKRKGEEKKNQIN